MRRLLASATIAILAVTLAPAPDLRATERKSRTEISWSGSLPRAVDTESTDAAGRRPLLVYIVNDVDTRDQERFDAVVMQNETLKITTKFFDCVRVSVSRAKEHDLLKDIRVMPPAVVLFDSSLKKHAVAGGRASAMKIYGVMCGIGKLDYKRSIGATVRAARNLLATFDQFDAANDAMGIKQGRVAEALGEGNVKKARQLEAELERERAENDALFEKAENRWQEIWKLGLERRK